MAVGGLPPEEPAPRGPCEVAHWQGETLGEGTVSPQPSSLRDSMAWSLCLTNHRFAACLTKTLREPSPGKRHCQCLRKCPQTALSRSSPETPHNLHRESLAAAEPGGEAPPTNPQQFPRGLQQVIDTAEHRNDGTLFGHGPSLVATS